MFDEVKSGDLIAVSGKGPVSSLIQVATLSLPNIGPLGRWGWAGASHVGVVQWVFPERSTAGEPLVYESTSFDRPPCVRAGRPIKGVQAHRLSTIIDGGGDVWHYPLRRPLYDHEQDRLLLYLESVRERSYDFLGAGKSGGGLLMRSIQRLKGKEDLTKMFCSELVVRAWIALGLMQHKNAGAWAPARVVRYVLRRGICEKGQRLS